MAATVPVTVTPALKVVVWSLLITTAVCNPLPLAVLNCKLPFKWLGTPLRIDAASKFVPDVVLLKVISLVPALALVFFNFKVFCDPAVAVSKLSSSATIFQPTSTPVLVVSNFLLLS